MAFRDSTSSMKHTLNSLSPRLLGASVLLGLLASCASDSAGRVRADVDDKIGHGEFGAALMEAAKFHKENPDNEVARDLHRKARGAWLLNKGRDLTFMDKDDEALEIFREVRDLVPEMEQAQQWVTKTENKLGTHWTNIGLELHAADNLPAAMEAYNKALSYLPDDVSATSGLATARFLSDYREGVGSGYYTNGVRALSEYYLQQASNAFEKVLKYKEKDRQSTERRNQVQVMLAEQRVHLATELEAEGLYGAARHEFKMAIDLDPDNSKAVEGEARASKEAQAKILLSNAEMQVLRGKFDEARAMLAEGAELSEVQDELFEGALAGIDSAIHEQMYVGALDLYRDGDYQGAVDAFDELLKVTDYYKDTRTRRDNLAGDIQSAQERYDLAMKAETDEERLRYLREIEVFWTNYKDIQAQIHRLDKRD